MTSAKDLADQDKHQFEIWALGLVGARPHELKKVPDRGIDGILYYNEGGTLTGKPKTIIISVKGGHVQVSHVRDLRGVLDREQAQIGVLITLNPPTAQMLKEAAEAGFYKPSGKWKSQHSRLQILTINELFAGKRIDYPTTGAGNVTFKRATKAEKKGKKPGGTVQIDWGV